MSLPKVVIFQEDEKSKNYIWRLPEDSDFNRKPIAVKSFEYDKDEFLKSNVVVIANKNFDLDTVFYLHPNKENVYIEQSKFENYIFNENIHRYIQMAQKLGAKKVNLTVELLEVRKLNVKAEGSIDAKAIAITGEFKKDVEEKFKKTYINNNEYTPSGNYDLVKNYKEALEWIDKENLYFDQDLVHFVKSRNPEIGNLLTKQELSIQLTQETNQLLEISASLTAGVVPVFKLKAGFKESVSMQKDMLLKIDLEF